MQKTCRVYTKRFLEVSTLRYHQYSQTNFPKLLNWWYRLLHKWDQAVTRFWVWHLSEKRLISFSQIMTLIIWNHSSIYWVQFGCQKICFIWLTDCQSQITRVTITKCESKKKCYADVPMKDPKCCQISTTANMEVKKCSTKILIRGQSMLIKAVLMVVLVLLVTLVLLMGAFKIL